MDFFLKYTSNTLAGSGNQYFFTENDPVAVNHGRVYFKVFSGGTHKYSFLFSNTLDSTFSDGSVSRKNRVLDSWKIIGLTVGVCTECSEANAQNPDEVKVVTFCGNTQKNVMPGEFFASDEVEITARKGEYICLEIAFSGRELPCHEESIIPSFRLTDGKWQPSKKVPFPSCVGCDRKVKAKIAFWGDSITQGIGTSCNSYEHWNAVLAEKLGERYAYWNLGLGFGRADDAASLGAWFYKAKQNDIVVVCFGVNDILQGYSADEVKKNIKNAVCALKKIGVRVVLQTVPPFDYTGENIEKHNAVNRFIKEKMCDCADLVFDCVPILSPSPGQPHLAKFGGHPNADGCRAWGEALFAFLSDKQTGLGE